MKTRSVTFVPVLLVIAFPQLVSSLDFKPKVDPLAQPLIDDGIAVGLVVGIVKDGETQVLSYGETTRGSGKAPDEDTVYEIGSISKVFTGILLADLVERGEVKLDDPVQKYLPDGVKMPVNDGQEITLEHLATHTSGRPRMPDNFAPANPMNPYADYGEKKLFAFLKKHELRRPPGEHEYSNYGAGLLGHVLSSHIGKSYEKAVVDIICKPLDMGDTTLTLSEDQASRMAPPYDAALQEVQPWSFVAMAGAGGIRSTTSDMLRFIEANLKKDDQPLTKGLRMAHVKRHDMENGLAMGLGWHIARDGITRWHNGMTAGYHGWLAVVPSHDLGVIVLANTANMKITQFGEQVTRVAFGLKVEPPEELTEIEVDQKVLESYAGEYAIVPQFILTVTVENGNLMVQATGQSKLPVYPKSKTKFFYKVVDAQLTFGAGDDGEIDHLILHQGGLNQKAVRKE